MKKTMFITSVIMVVVMAIALTTSSLAWFTAAGSSTVTTSSMTLTAKATSAAGLLISQADTGDWSSNIDLVEGNAQANMIPATPYEYEDGKAFIDAMVADKFITNTVDMNGNYSDADPVKANGTDILYFSDTFYITTVDTQNDLDVTPSIKWEKYDAGSSTWKTYTSDTSVAGRIAPASADPIIYVAVLASKLTYTAADRDPSNKTWTTAAAEDSSNWEILNVFASKGGTTVNFGLEESTFKSTSSSAATIAASQTSLPILTGTGHVAIGTTSTGLAKVTTHYSTGDAQGNGEVRVYKVLAWYDGYTLQNSNSNFALRFDLGFTASTHSGS